MSPMGCVYNRGTRANPNWWINWREHAANRYQRIGEDKALAKSVLKQIEAGIQARRLGRRYGVKTTPPPPIPTFDAAADASLLVARRQMWTANRCGARGRMTRRGWISTCGLVSVGYTS